MLEEWKSLSKIKDMCFLPMQEEWKDIPNYKDFYQVSNYGRVKSLSRIVKHSLGGSKIVNSRILKNGKDFGGYPTVSLSRNGSQRSFTVHKLVMRSFCGESELHVDHLNEVKTYNLLYNLEYVTHRENISRRQDKTKTSSKYIGVSWNKEIEKWGAFFRINGKLKYLGSFTNEEEAGRVYQERLKVYLETKLKVINNT